MAQSSVSGKSDFGLLLLRIALGINLFFRHGLAKVTHFSRMAAHFPDPIHIGSHWSLMYAMVSDAICSLLVALGLGTRVAAVVVVVDVGVAFCLVNHYPFRTSSGEIMLLYIGGFLALVFMGAGRFSLDWRFWGRS